MAHKLNPNKVIALLEQENEFITNLLTIFDVPDSVHDDKIDDLFLINSKQPIKNAIKKLKTTTDRAQTADELQEKMEIMRNKMNSKKAKPSERTLKKRQLKKFKKDKELKKRIISVAKSVKNEKAKEGKAAVKQEAEDSKDDVKPGPIYNEEGKMIFSKFEFAAQPSKAKKSKKSKVEKNPKIILKQIRQQKREIGELIEQGDTEKASEIKQTLAWKKAFDKTEGIKVKDNTALLQKTIKRKKVFKKKSKTDWKNREQKVVKDQEAKQKKRTDNINKKKDEKKKNKLKKLAKRGRIIPGYG